MGIHLSWKLLNIRFSCRELDTKDDSEIASNNQAALSDFLVFGLSFGVRQVRFHVPCFSSINQCCELNRISLEFAGPRCGISGMRLDCWMTDGIEMSIEIASCGKRKT